MGTRQEIRSPRTGASFQRRAGVGVLLLDERAAGAAYMANRSLAGACARWSHVAHVSCKWVRFPRGSYKVRVF